VAASKHPHLARSVALALVFLAVAGTGEGGDLLVEPRLVEGGPGRGRGGGAWLRTGIVAADTYGRATFKEFAVYAQPGAWLAPCAVWPGRPGRPDSRTRHPALHLLVQCGIDKT
jgi:hypothetical protein